MSSMSWYIEPKVTPITLAPGTENSLPSGEDIRGRCFLPNNQMAIYDTLNLPNMTCCLMLRALK